MDRQTLLDQFAEHLEGDYDTIISVPELEEAINAFAWENDGFGDISYWDIVDYLERYNWKIE